MIVDIFYPILALTTTILVCFIKKKAKLFREFVPTCSPRHHPVPPGGLTAPYKTPTPRTDVPIFFLYYPLAHQKNPVKNNNGQAFN